MEKNNVTNAEQKKCNKNPIDSLNLNEYGVFIALCLAFGLANAFLSCLKRKG